MRTTSPFIVSFKDVDHDDIALVGGKGANLGEMTKAGFPVPPGFIVTSAAYEHFLGENKLQRKIKTMLAGLDIQNTVKLTRVSRDIRSLINHTAIPDTLATSIMKSYLVLGRNVLVAVRSSATAEDLPGASFAGQQETFLNVSGEANVIDKVRDAWSSLFTPRAIFYREQKKFDHFRVGIAIPIQRMVQSDVSGVMFTINPVTNDKSVVVIEAIWGLGELIVQGSVTPDHYEVLKRTMTIQAKQIERQLKLMRRKTSDHLVVNEIRSVARDKQQIQKLPDRFVVDLARLGVQLQEHYFFPQDAEWALENGELFLVQTRPITTIGDVEEASLAAPGASATKGLTKIITGQPASPGLASGPAIVIKSVKEIAKVKKGDVLVMSMTTPDFVPAMKKAVAIVTDQGGQTSHAAIVSRELGVPCVVGTERGTRLIKQGHIITVNGSSGDVFRGSFHVSARVRAVLPTTRDDVEASSLETATKLYVNLAEPELAERVAAEPVDGVGLLRAEFMMAEIGIHPKKAIAQKKSKEYVGKLADGLMKFADAFFPRPVIYRASDFRTNEYRNLSGGDTFEPHEENPMLGFRGAFRYIKDPDVFELELAAILHAREHRSNLHLMIPFVRSVDELRKVKRIVYAAHLERSSSFHFYMMTELPVNVILIDEFIDVGIDGISIGSNDLTMLTLGTDRDNETIASEYSELNPAVLWSLKRLIRSANKHKIASSICGQAPSVYPELTEQLVSWGITSISVAPDRIGVTRKLIYEAERKRVSKDNN